MAWRSSDPSVAVVDSAGRVTGITAGRGTLAASGGDLVLELPIEVYPIPATITLLAGDGQRAPAGQRLAVPLKAQIVSRGGRPMAGVPVRFTVAEPTGRIEPDIDTSDADGIVQAVWTLGDRPGRQRSALAVDGEPPIATSLAADAEPVAGNTRITRGRASRGRGWPRAGRADRGAASPIPRVRRSATCRCRGKPRTAARSSRTARGPTRSGKPGRAGHSAHARVRSGPMCRWARRARCRVP